MIKQYKLRFYNFRLVVFLLAISFIGIHLVGTAADYLRTRQLLGVIIGVVFMLLLSLMDYSWLLNFQWIMYGFNIVMLLAVRFFGSSANGAARWVDLGFIRFQPTELSKIIIILFFAISVIHLSCPSSLHLCPEKHEKKSFETTMWFQNSFFYRLFLFTKNGIIMSGD